MILSNMTPLDLIPLALLGLFGILQDPTKKPFRLTDISPMESVSLFQYRVVSYNTPAKIRYALPSHGLGPGGAPSDSHIPKKRRNMMNLPQILVKLCESFK
jgi:hypothetical protein